MSLIDPDLFRRRAGVYSRRSLRTVTGRGLNSHCLFLHLPKCGGTSLAAGLYGTVPLHRRVGVVDAVSTRRAAAISAFGVDDPVLCHEDLEHGHHTFSLRENIVLTHMAWDTPLIHGHFFLSSKILTNFGSKYRLVTMMRNPLERALSNYRMAVRAGIIPDDIDQWLESGVAASMSRSALRYIGGHNRIPTNQVSEVLVLALSRLKRFSMIGFLENLSAFQRRFRQEFGVIPSMPHLNGGKGSYPSLSSAQQDRLDQLLDADREIYSRAMHLFPDLAPDLPAVNR